VNFQILVKTVFLALFLYSASAWSFPIGIDSDADNIPDTLELFMSGDLSPDGTLDTDSDGIPDIVEDNITFTDKNNDDRVICPGTAPTGTDLTGLWDVRISDDLSQDIDVIQDVLDGVSICHTNSELQIFHPEAGYASGVSFDGSNLSFTFVGEVSPDEDFVISDATFTAGGGAFSKGRVDDTSAMDEGESKEIRLDRRTTKTEWQTNFTPANAEGVFGTQDTALGEGMDDGPINSPLNPASGGGEVRLDDTTPTQALLYIPDGVIGGYMIPSTGSFVVVGRVPTEEGLDLDGDLSADDQIIEDIEVYIMVTEPPAAGVGGMLRGIADSSEYQDFNSDFTQDVFIESFDTDVYGKAKGPIAEHRTSHIQTSSGSRVASRLVLFNPYLSAITVTASGGNITSGSNTFVDNDDGDSDNDTDEVILIQNRIPPHRDGEKVGFTSNGTDIKTNLLIFQSEGNVESGQTFESGTYTFSFTGADPAPLADETVVFADHSDDPLDIIQNLRINDVSSSSVIEGGRLIDATRNYDITWNEVTSSGVSNNGANKYQLRIENNDRDDAANDEVGDADRLVLSVNSSVCSGGTCSATVEGNTFEVGDIFTIRGVAIDSDASENRSITNKRYIIAGDTTTCSINSNESGNITNGVPCGEYYELGSNVRTYDNSGGGGTNNDGVLQRYALFRPSGTPKGMVVLIPGGRGGAALRGDAGTHELFTSSTNFLIRSAKLFADAGYLVAATGRPTDQSPSSNSAYDHHRVSANHAHDLAAIINEIKDNETLPNLDVFLVGTSRGGISVTRQWALGGGIAVSVPVNVNADTDGGTPGIQPPGQVPVGDCTTGDGDGMACHTTVGVPVHYMWHEDDTCRGTAPALLEGVLKDDLFNEYPAPSGGIYGSLTNQFDEFLTGSGIDPYGSNDCGSLYAHGFIGQEIAAVGNITNYLDSVLASLGSNSAPEVAPNATRYAIVGSARTIDLSALAEDLDGDSLSYELPFEAEAIGSDTTRGGSLSLTGSIVTYTPTASAGITDSFVYTAVDGNGGRSAGVVTVILSADTDSDGIADAYETAVGGLVVGINDAAGDFDSDGFTNLEEYEAGTNANDDADFPGILAFTSASFDVDEDVGTFGVTVTRPGGGTAGTVSVQCTVADGSAMSPDDYTATSPQTLVWVDGESGEKTCDVMVDDDSDPESQETVMLSLSNVTGGAKIGTPSTATLNINDNDTVADSVPHDITGDGKSDVLIRHSSTNAWYLYGLNGRTVESRGGIGMTGNGLWQTRGIGDFTGDGTSDVLIRNTSTGSWYLNELDGRTISSRGTVGMTSNQNWEFVGAADVTGDGRSDVLVRHNSTNAWYLYELNGRTVLSRGGIGMTGNGAWVPQAVADFTGDGTADVLIRNTNTGAWYLNELDGRTISSRGTVGMTSNLNWEFVGAGDVTGDGRADVLVRHNSTNAWYLYELNGRTVVSRGGIGMTGNGAWEPQQVEDFTGDGTADVMIRHTTTGGWYLNELDGRTISGRGSVGMTNNQNWQPQ